MKQNNKPKQRLENGLYPTQVVQLEWKQNHKQQSVLSWTLQVTAGPYREQLIYHENVLDGRLHSYFNLRSDLLVGGLILKDGINAENTNALQPLIGQAIQVEIQTRGNRTSTTFVKPDWLEQYSFYLAVGIPLPDEEMEEFSQRVHAWCEDRPTPDYDPVLRTVVNH